MSPEAQNPGTQAGSDKFVEGHHPTDGVRAFKHGDLADVAPMLQVPDSPGVIDQTTLETEVTKIPLERKSNKKRLASIVAGIVGAAVLGGGGYAGYRATQGDEPHAKPEISAPVNPGPEVSGETQTTEFELVAEKYAENPALIMVDFADIYNSWQNTGVTTEAANADKRFEMSDEEYAAYLNKQSDQAFLSAVLVPDWQNNPHLVDWVADSTRNHQTNSWAAIITSDTNGTEKVEPYRRYVDIDKESIVVQDVTKKQIVVSATWAGRANTDQNNIDEIRTAGIDPNQEQGDYTLTFSRTADGTMQLADVQSYID